MEQEEEELEEEVPLGTDLHTSCGMERQLCLGTLRHCSTSLSTGFCTATCRHLSLGTEAHCCTGLLTGTDLQDFWGRGGGGGGGGGEEEEDGEEEEVEEGKEREDLGDTAAGLPGAVGAPPVVAVGGGRGAHLRVDEDIGKLRLEF